VGRALDATRPADLRRAFKDGETTGADASRYWNDAVDNVITNQIVLVEAPISDARQPSSSPSNSGGPRT
jgi:hypothetical protein